MDPNEIILRLIDEAYEKKAWHGPNLRGSVRGLTAVEAARRPAHGRHNIWEIVVHAAYWKYTVRRRLLGEKRGSFPLKGSNWFPRSETDANESGWRTDLALLDEMHRGLRSAVADLPVDELETTPPGSKVSNLTLLTGIAAHDVYHAGQIQLLKKLVGAGHG